MSDKKYYNKICMYCEKQLVNGQCDCKDWNIQNTINFSGDTDNNSVLSSEHLNEDDEMNLFINALNKMKPSFEYECPNCLGKFNTPHCVQNKESLHNHCPFCGLYMTGLSNV